VIRKTRAKSREEVLEDEILRWWKGFKPVAWDMSEFAATPCVNQATDRDARLARCACKIWLARERVRLSDRLWRREMRLRR
jgi:hypothetical protein